MTQSTKELSSRTPLCFSKLLVSRIVTDNRQFSRLPVKFLLSYRIKKFVGDFFCVPEGFGYQEGFELTERISRFSVGSILSHRTENYHEGFFCVAGIVCYPKSL